MLSTGDALENNVQDQQEQWALNLVKQEETIRIDARLEADLVTGGLAAKRRRKDSDEDVSSSFARPSAKQCVYKIETLASISREEENDDEDKTNVARRRNVSCDAVVSPGGFCIVVASQIHLLDSSCMEHKATINLDCEPELVAFSRNSSFLVVGDSLGTIHFIHVESKNIVFSQEICPETEAIETGYQEDKAYIQRTPRNAFHVLCFASSDSMETEELLVVLRNNVLFRFSNIDVAKLQRAISEQNFALAGEVKSSITIERLDLGSALSSASPFSIRDIAVHYDSRGSNTIVAGTGRYPISCWRRVLEDDDNPNPKMVLSDGIHRLLKGVGIKKVQLSFDENYMVVLNDAGGLSIWQYSSMIMLRSYPEVALSDFNIMPCTTSLVDSTDVDNMPPQISVVVLTSAKSGDDHILDTDDARSIHQTRFLQIISLPKYEVTHSVEVASACWLVKSQAKPEDKNDTVHFVEARGFSGTAGGIKELYLRSLSETVPLTRFQQLIAKQRFEEAAEFAKQFDLDVQAVLKAKLSHTLEIMTESSNPAGLPGKVDIETIIADINHIKDLSFAVDFCLQAVVPSYSATYRLLSYARGLVQDFKSTDDGVISSAVVAKVHQAARRFGTWQLIEYNSDRPLESTLECVDMNEGELAFDGSAWQRFRTADMVVEMRNLIGRGKLRMAIVLWRRHYLEENLLNYIQDILVELADDVPASEYIPWLRNEVLPYIQNTDDRLKIGVWIEQRARLIEAREKKPHNALDVVRLLEVNITRENENPNGGGSASALIPATPARYVERTILLAHTAVYSTFGIESNVSSAPGSELRKQLEDLVYLWDEHNFKLSLSDYSQSTPRGIALDLLDCVAAPELLKDAIDTHFSKYVERMAGLNYDDLLVEYCMEVMDGAAGLGMSLANAPWEARVMAVLGSIRNGDSRLDVIVEIMRRTPVPWSDSVQKAIDDALSQSGLRRADELREQYRLMQLKNMLIRYGITVFNISDLSLAKGLVSHILGRTDLPEAMDDALQVVNAYHHLSKADSYVLRMQNLCEANRTDLLVQLLKSMVETEKDGDSADPLPRILYSSAQETLTWLLEIMEGLRDYGVSHEEAFTKRYDPVAIQTFDWAIRSAFEITKFLLKSNEEGTCAQLYIATPQLLDDLTSLQSLYQEYNVILLPTELKAKDIRQNVVRNMMKITSAGEQSKRSLDSLHTAVYRIADILRINRFDMKGILAEEATLSGNFQEASLLCKEMLEKQPDAETAKMLRRIAFLMSKHSMENCAQVYKSNQMNFRLTNRIQSLCQEAMLICNESLLGDCLDEYKSYEIQNAIFAQCESGDYGSLVDTLEIDFERPASGSSSSQPAPSSQSNSIRAVKAIQPTDAAPMLKDKYAAVLFADQYFENGLVMDTSTAMKSVGEFVVQRIRQGDPMLAPRGPSSTASKKGKSKSEDQGDALFYSAAANLSSYLKESRTYQAAIRVFQRAQEHVLRNGRPVQVGFLEPQQYCELLEICVQKVLSSRFIDNSLALAYMISLPLDKAFSAFRAGLSTVGSDYHRLLRFSGIGMSCATVWKQRTFFVDCKQLRSNARWWHQLKLLDIPFDDGQFRNCKDGEYQRKLVPMLLEKTSQDVITVLDFSRAYHIEDDFVLLEFIKTSILSGKLDSYENQVTGVIEDVVNKSKLLALFTEQCIPRISPYDYERLQFVQKHVQMLDRHHEGARKGLIVLDILKNYTRTRLPNVAELSNARRFLEDVEVTLRPEDLEANIEKFPASLRRLPFHGIMEEPWEVLKPELSEDTIPRLLPLTIPLDMHPDKFHVTVIDNLISQQKQSPSQTTANSSSAGEPSVGTISSRIKFSDFRGLILKIRDTELAISSAKYVADVFPCGTDKIQALKTAVTVAEKWYQKITTGGQTDNQTPEMAERAQVAVGRLRDSLARAETEHQLRTNGFDQFVELVSQPLELVCQLYAQKSEEALMKKDFPDLHVITSDVARRHNLDVDKIRQYLLTSWLTQDGEPSLSREEGSLPSARMQPVAVGSDHGYAGKETQLQMKILYLLRVGAVEKNVAFLLNFAYQQRASQKVTTLMRVRSLSVLFQLASPQEIAQVHNYPEVRAYLQMLLYLADFEEIRISQTLKEFNGCSKDALARSLWVAHSDEPKVVQLICNMCLDYRVYDTTLWENALLRLLKFGKIHYLQGLLEHVSSVPKLAQIKSLPHLWNNVLLGCLSPSDAGDVGTEHSSAMRTRVCLLLQKCPFLPELDLDQFMDNFERLATDEAGTCEALRMLSFIPAAAGVRERVQKLVARLDSGGLIRALNVMQPSKVRLDDTETGISKTTIMQVIYAQIEKRKGHRELFAAQYPLSGYVSYLVANSPPGRRLAGLESLVKDGISVGNVREAREVVKEWYRRWGVKDVDRSDLLEDWGMDGSERRGEKGSEKEGEEL